MTSIPANRLVNVTPSVESAGGTGLDIQGLYLTQSNRVPVGQVYPFANADDVSVFFGPDSTEYSTALKYFAGFNGSPIKPANVLFAQYMATAVAAYLRGGSLGSLTLNQLKAITGVLSLQVNGNAVASASLNLSAATSFSNAAALIQAALGYSDAVFTASQTGNVLTVTAVASGVLAVGQVVTGVGIPNGTTITALGTGTGGAGTYTLSTSQTISSESMSSGALTVAFDSVSNAFVLTAGTPGAGNTITVAAATGSGPALALTAAAGAVTSQGAAASTPASAMAAVTAATQNFVTFSTIWKPADADMISFAQWADGQKARWPYIQWDNNAAMTVVNDTTSAAAQIKALGYQGTSLNYTTQGPFLSGFIMGAIASIDFNKTNGRTNIALLSQTGFIADVTDGPTADNLKANGYNYYGAFATANDNFLLYYPGSVTGPFLWMDSLINSIWMTNNFQLAGVELLVTVHNIPYNTDGAAIVDINLLGVITDAVNFGAIRKGVTLSAQQAADVNNQAGVPIDGVLTARGWYLQVGQATPEVRAARGSPPITFWYTDGESVQQLNLNTIAVL